MTNKSIRTTVCALILAIAPAIAALDIVESKSKWVLKDTSSGRVLGTFWSPNDGGSDFGYESSIAPNFPWSPDREYLTEDEAFEKWNTLISVRGFDGTDDPRAYAFQLAMSQLRH